MMDVKRLVHGDKDLIIQTRQDLHRIPEIAYTEEKTSAYVAESTLTITWKPQWKR